MKQKLTKLIAVALIAVTLLGLSLPLAAASARRDPIGDFVTRLYVNALGRRPDPSGFDFWCDQLRSGATGSSVAYGFIFSTEVIRSNLSNEQFVELLYVTLLDRRSDAGGKAHWVSLLTSGSMRRVNVFTGFVNSPEFSGLCESYGIVVGVFTPPTVYNPLTGERWHQDLENSRPWAVSLGNTRPAMPMHGIADADIVWEFVVEDGMTRIIAVYHDVSGVGAIGSIRSLRTSSYEMMMSYDALFVNAGGRDLGNNDISGQPYITSLGTLDARAVGYRDEYRRYTLQKSFEDTLMTTGGDLFRSLANLNIRTEHTASYVYTQRFTESGMPADGKAAQNVEVRFSTNPKTTSFTYSSQNNAYHVRQFGSDMIDGNGGIMPAFTNILVLQTHMQFRANPPQIHTDVRTTGTGTGYYINGGKYVEITWSRADIYSPFVYRLKSGTELALGVGKTYVCMISSDQTPTFS